MHAHHDVEALHLLPERVELGQGERLAALPGRHRRHPNQEDLGAALVHELQLLQGLIDPGGQADDRRGEDGVGVHEGPVLMHPGIDGPRIMAAGHAITPTGGHLDPTMFQRIAPHVMPLSIQEGIADGVPEVRQAVRYQIKYGARLIKISASGGVMSHSGAAGAQQYSDDELAAIVDEAHRAGLRVAAHAHGDAGIKACIRAGVDCIEHGSLASDETIQMMVDHGTFLVPTSYLSEGLDISRAAPELQAKAAQVFPLARQMLGKAIASGVKIACGTDAPAIPHGDNAKELWAMVDRGMTPMQALQAATIRAAELIDVDDRGRLAAGLLADIIAVPGDPSMDITTTQDVRFVMKGGQIYKQT